MENNKTKKQIVVFGGCFNPPLNSHFSLAQQMINEYRNIKKIIFVPVNNQYQKDNLIDNEHRYQMLKLVCDKNEKFEVSRVEIDYPRQLYTIETLANIQEQQKEYEICFMMGSDNLKELETWHHADKLVKNFGIYVFERDGDNIEKIIQSSHFLKQNIEKLQRVENHLKSNLSSTFAREKIKCGKSIRYIAPDEVISYIKENNLYQSFNGRN